MNKEFKKVLREAERRGWSTRQIKNGIQLIPPDKTKPLVTVHGTPSDRRAFANFMSQMRRSGFAKEETR